MEHGFIHHKRSGPVAAEMKAYIAYINAALGVEVKYISNGPGRDQLVTV